MSDRNLGAEILAGLDEIKQFKKGNLALRTYELSALSASNYSVKTENVSVSFCRSHGSKRSHPAGLGARA